MYKNSIIVNVNHGIHIRIAALIVHKASELKDKYNVNLYIKSSTSIDPIAISMLALISLKIKENEIIEISSDKDNVYGQKAVLELCNFITKGLNNDNTGMEKIDAILEQNNIANEQILENIPMGIVVIDVNCYITTINEYALNILGSTSKDVIGRYINDIIPTSKLPYVISSKVKQLGEIQHVNNHITVVNRSPIISNNEVIGGISVFQDMSEIIGIKEINEKFKSIMETSHDLICFVDENRKISYINPSYEKIFNTDSKHLIGKDINDISPNGFRMKVFNNHTKIENNIHNKNGVEIISTITPMFLDGEFKGVLSISKTINEIKDLLTKLKKSEEQLDYYKNELKKHTLSNPFENVIGITASFKNILTLSKKAADSNSSILITGEDGTGKELIATSIHNTSNRKDKPFVKINCSDIPENLLESEFFGYEKNVFDGIHENKPGKFKIANGGTIFLEEVGSIPKSIQSKLLRVLEEKDFQVVGSSTTQKVDVRIIASTSKNLMKLIETGDFRKDLYYKLNIISLPIPSLKNRKEDIPLLVDFFIDKINKKINKNILSVSDECLKCFENYNWPGNIEELKNVLERAVNMCDSPIISTKDLPIYITSSANKKEHLINFKDGDLMPLEYYEKEIIKLAIEKYHSYNKAGKVLGVTHRTVSLKCKKYGIDISSSK